VFLQNSGKNGARLSTKGLDDNKEFQQVDAALAPFVGRNEGLRLSQPLGERDLRNAFALAHRR